MRRQITRLLNRRHRVELKPTPSDPERRAFAGCNVCRTQGPIRMTALEADKDARDHIRLVHGGQDTPGAYIEFGVHMIDLALPTPPPANPTTGRYPDCPDEGDPEFLCATKSRWFPIKVKVGLIDALGLVCFGGAVAVLIDSLLTLSLR
jgi:hypothetical protein